MKRSRYGDHKRRIRKIQEGLSVVGADIENDCADDATLLLARRISRMLRTLRDRIAANLVKKGK